MASAYACAAGVKMLSVLGDMIASGDLAGSGFWEFLAAEFPSTTDPTDDKKPQAAMLGIDAAMSVLNPGAILIPDYMVFLKTANPGSLIADDRSSDANSVMTFVSMALIGTLQNRYGNPSSNHHKTTDLPWVTAIDTKGTGCAFAAGILNFYDSLTYLKTVASGSAASTYASIQGSLSSALTTGCTRGCTFCGGAVSCTSCPTTLRDRSSCTGETTDENSCAAAGLTNVVNLSWDGPP
jgi:hypothetical protein